MSIPGAANPLLLATAAAGGYQISRSLRFNSSDSAFLSRTPASAGNRKTWTWAGWVKKSAVTAGAHYLFSSQEAANTNNVDILGFESNLLYYYQAYTGATYSVSFVRDPSAWYHIIFALDTTQATEADRLKIYLNGIEQPLNTGFIPAQNRDTAINAVNSVHQIGRYITTASSNFYLADVHFIDGQALTPSSFTEVSATTGQLIPKAYTGSFGTNGFWLKFSDNSAATATTLGKDYSGNNNNWTPNNLSVTAGAGNDSLVDTPTSYGTDTGAGGEVRGNYATLNPLQNTGNTLSNGNLDVSIASTNWTGSTVAMTTGKWYTEFTVGSTGTIQMFGVCNADFYGTGGNAPWITAGAKEVTYYVSDGRVYVDGVNTGTTSGATAGNIISFAFDADARSVAIRKNNTLLTTKTITASAAGYIFYVSSGGGSCTATLNYGARPFAYTAPSGFKALCDTNLPAPVVAKPNTVMDVKLYTGNGTSQTISGLGFSPDFVWLKSRGAAYNHQLFDTIRGTGKQLFSNLTSAETTESFSWLNAFNSNGFGVTGAAGVNDTNDPMVAWCFDAGSSTSTNTAGSISSQVRANASAGFSIVTYTGNGTLGATFGHGLNIKPGMVIVKNRTTASEDNWAVWHDSLGVGNWMYLNLTSAEQTGTSRFNSTDPSSTLVTLGNSGNTNRDTHNYVCYAFAPVAGYSAFGSYTGNGSADGPFVYTGFRPRWVMWKNTTSAGSWYIHDSARSTYNVTKAALFPNLSDSENSTYSDMDILSNGFKQRRTDSDNNASGNTYVWAAFAESPFQYARAR